MNKSRHKAIGITKYRFYELRYFCMQYGQWAHKIRDARSTDGEKAECAAKLRLVDESVHEAAPEIAPFLLESVTHEGVSYDTLRGRGMPCGKNYFYDARRMFFIILDRKRGTQGTLV